MRRAARSPAFRSPASRTRTRRRLLLAGVLPLLLCVALALKVGVMLVHDRTGRAALADDAPAQARDAFAANGTLNLIQAWVAPYDEGVARFTLRDHAGAVVSFEEALTVAPPEEQCRVRTNLALSQEAVGDRAAAAGEDLVAQALGSWRRAREALADGGCVEPGSTATTVDARLREKLAALRPPAGPTPDADPDPAQPREPSSQQKEELQQRNRTGQARRVSREQREQRQTDQDLQPPEGQGPAPAPTW